MAALLALLPVLAVLGGVLGGRLGGPFSRMHATASLAERVWLEEAGEVEGDTDASRAFRETGRPAGELFGEALKLRGAFTLGGRIFGAFVGLVMGLKLVQLSTRRTRPDYEPDRAACFSCGRCFLNCPRARARLKGIKGAVADRRE